MFNFILGVNSGQVHFITGDYEAAGKDYIKSIELEPTFVFSHIQYGVSQYKLGNISDAMETFKKALIDFPESGEVNNYYGELLLDQQSFDQAYFHFDKAIKLKPSNPLPYINKALLLFQWKQDPAGAERLCLQSLEGIVSLCFLCYISCYICVFPSMMSQFSNDLCVSRCLFS